MGIKKSVNNGTNLIPIHTQEMGTMTTKPVSTPGTIKGIELGKGKLQPFLIWLNLKKRNTFLRVENLSTSFVNLFNFRMFNWKRYLRKRKCSERITLRISV